MRLIDPSFGVIIVFFTTLLFVCTQLISFVVYCSKWHKCHCFFFRFSKNVCFTARLDSFLSNIFVCLFRHYANVAHSWMYQGCVPEYPSWGRFDWKCTVHVMWTTDFPSKRTFWDAIQVEQREHPFVHALRSMLSRLIRAERGIPHFFLVTEISQFLTLSLIHRPFFFFFFFFHVLVRPF